MVTKEEVQRIAKLARLGLTEGEVEKFQKELSLILDYVEKLKEADVSAVEPTSHPLKVENIMRADKERLGAESANPRKLVEIAPDKKEEYIRVKQILK